MCDLTVIAQKKDYVVCCLTKSPKVFCYVNMSNFNNFEHDELLFNQKIRGARCINKERLVKSGAQGNAALRSSYLPLFEQLVSTQANLEDG